MKPLIVTVMTLVIVTSAQAGIIGWFTSKTQDWQFIQKSGGIRISSPVLKNGKVVLPVDYWPEGNSGLAVRKIELKQRDSYLIIRVITQLVEKDSDTARTHYVDLTDIPNSRYDVYYETAGDLAKHLGTIEIR